MASNNPAPQGFNKLIGKRLYLATYSQANETRFPTRKSFGDYIVEKFNAGNGKVKVMHWVVCKESHEGEGFHYHCAFKMTGVKKWYAPWRAMYTDGVTVSFSDSHNYYASAYYYCTKMDEYFYESPDHPDMTEIGSPRTSQCMKANRRKSMEKNEDSGSTSAKVPRQVNKKLKDIDVGDYVVKNNITTKTQLYAEASRRKEEGECDLQIYIYTHTEKHLLELIKKAWELSEAEEKLTDNSLTRMARMESAANGDCVSDDCEWLKRAEEVLSKNKIERADFSGKMKLAMERGRRKFNNIMLVGKSNCAKTFLLKPLKDIFGDKLFENPTNDKYGWQGVDNAQVICLQDFRYSGNLISWSDFLLLLEGETVKLPTPKNHFAEDIVLKNTNDVPIFATGPHKIEYSRQSPNFERETDMMDSRWHVIKLTHVFKKEDQLEIKPCKRCFAKLVLE